MSRMKSRVTQKRTKGGQDTTDWTDRTHSNVLSTVRLSDEARDVVSALDMVAHEMEMKWGVDRLSKLWMQSWGLASTNNWKD